MTNRQMLCIDIMCLGTLSVEQQLMLSTHKSLQDFTDQSLTSIFGNCCPTNNVQRHMISMHDKQLNVMHGDHVNWYAIG